ncbi:alpha/beta hydrolase [Mycolicibacterium rutilum]|nr:alpha/beta hydrolase [Mycolicibacterium rutilum]
MDRAVTYIGRIGGLAVALGVGAAAFSGGGVAWAQTEDSGPDTPASAPAEQESEQSPSAEPAEPSEPAEPESDDVRSAPVGVVVSTGGAHHRDDDPQEPEPEPEPAPESAGTVKRDKDRVVTEPEPAAPTAQVADPVEPATPPEPDLVEVTEPVAPQPVEAPPAETVVTVAPDREPDPAPVSTTATLLSAVLTTVLAPLADGPAQPAPPPPIPLTLMAFARREVDSALLSNAPVVESVSTPMAAAEVTDAEPVFTGRPSLVTQIFVAGLRLIKPVLNLFGIELNGTSARIPFFTDGVPPFFVTFGLKVSSSEYQGWKVWTLAPPEPTEKVVVAMHGGAFISTASLFHWWTYADLARDTGATVVVPLYPLANAQGTGGTAKTVVPTVADFIAAQVDTHGRDNVSVLGDSAGGSIALAAAQELVRRCDGDQACLAATLPGRLVLLSPALDSSMTNPAIADVDDPLLSAASSKRNGLWWSRGLETPGDPDGTQHPLSSPIYGSLAGLPPTTVYAGSLDLRTPDVLVLQQKASATPGADFTFELRNGQVHDWTIFPFLPDAHAERPKIYRDLGLVAEV